MLIVLSLSIFCDLEKLFNFHFNYVIMTMTIMYVHARPLTFVAFLLVTLSGIVNSLLITECSKVCIQSVRPLTNIHHEP